jgi:hypothetical protein
MRSVVFLHENKEWMIFEAMRRMHVRQQWIRYDSNWPIALQALRQLWETGKVSELKSPFWESLQKPANKQ